VNSIGYVQHFIFRGKRTSSTRLKFLRKDHTASHFKSYFYVVYEFEMQSEAFFILHLFFFSFFSSYLDYDQLSKLYGRVSFQLFPLIFFLKKNPLPMDLYPLFLLF